MVLEVWRVEVVHLSVLCTAAASSELNTTAWVRVAGQGVSEHHSCPSFVSFQECDLGHSFVLL